jgi:hypothetical protein
MATVLKLGPPAPRRIANGAIREFWRTWVTPVQWRMLGYALLALLAYGMYVGVQAGGTTLAMIGRSPCGCLGG